MTNIEYSFLITTFAGLSTMLGALLIFFKVKNTDRVVYSSLAFASGVMITVGITDLIPSSLSGFLNMYHLIPSILLTLIFIVVGIVLSTIINKYIPDIDSSNISNKGLFKVGIISMIAIILHNIPEDCSCYVSQINLKYNIGEKII